MDEESRHGAVLQTVRHLALRWEHADKQILRFVFRLLAEGKPVTAARIAGVVGAAPGAVEKALELARAGRDANEQVVELSGLTLNPTMHRLQIGDKVLFGCCALLAQLAALLVKETVRIDSVDPVSRRVVRLDVGPQGVGGIDPPEAMASFVVTDAASIAQDVGSAFCRHVNYFVSYDAAVEFAGASRQRYVLTIAELHEGARRLYEEAWASSSDVFAV